MLSTHHKVYSSSEYMCNDRDNIWQIKVDQLFMNVTGDFCVLFNGCNFSIVMHTFKAANFRGL